MCNKRGRVMPSVLCEHRADSLHPGWVSKISKGDNPSAETWKGK